MSRRLLFVELNEFNLQLMKSAATTFNLAHLNRALALPFQRKTVTSDHYDSGYLEPWVQWVSVHTGTPSSEHKIKHLGDVKSLSHKQIWEHLSENGISSGVWSALNATRGHAGNCKFFLPDPWTFEEVAYPSELNSFLCLPRYMARNYLRPSRKTLVKYLVNFAFFMCRPKAVIALLAELPYFLFYAVKYRAANFVTYSFAEYLATIRFIDYWKRNRPQFSSVFLNLVAHTQHYYWQDVPLKDNERLKYTLRYLNKILGVIFKAVDSNADILVANALTQINTNAEEPWILYRQNDHGEFLRRIGLSPLKVEACMTHDAHIFFKDADECQAARSVLQSVHVDGKKFFYVEDYPAEPSKLFYMIEFSEPVNKDTILTWSGGSMRMLDEFTPIIRRTAKHSEVGIAMSTADILPELPFPNHGIYDVILKYFGLNRAQT